METIGMQSTSFKPHVSKIKIKIIQTKSMQSKSIRKKVYQ